MSKMIVVALTAVVVALGISGPAVSSAFAEANGRSVPNADWASEGATRPAGEPIPCGCPHLFPPIASQTSPLPDVTHQDHAPSTVGSAETVRADSGTEKAGNATRNESCWRPGMSRNIGIAEPACDASTSKPRTPESKSSHSRKSHPSGTSD